VIRMTVFLGIHKLVPGMSETDVREGYEKYKQGAVAKGLKPLGAVVSMEKGFAYCQTEAQSAQEVKEAHEGAAVPLEDVVEVKTLG